MKRIESIIDQILRFCCYHFHDLSRWVVRGERCCMECGRKHRVEWANEQEKTA